MLMTAIMVAGRSGSSFAAQLGSMKLAEEVDAMRTIGVSPMEALVLPRVFATVLMMPLLGFYAAIVAIIGGAVFCWISLEIPPVTFVQRIREVVPLTDLWQLLIKAPVFGLIISLAGCFQGMQVKSDAEEVGLRTTTAVVQAIFLVIVLDASSPFLHRDRLAVRKEEIVSRSMPQNSSARRHARRLDLEVKRGEIPAGRRLGDRQVGRMSSIIGMQRPTRAKSVFGEPASRDDAHLQGIRKRGQMFQGADCSTINVAENVQVRSGILSAPVGEAADGSRPTRSSVSLSPPGPNSPPMSGGMPSGGSPALWPEPERSSPRAHRASTRRPAPSKS